MLLTILVLGGGVRGGRLVAGPLAGLCGTAARNGTSGCLPLCATSATLTPVTSSRLLKGASSMAKRAARPGNVSMSLQVLCGCFQSPVLSLMLLWFCCCAPEKTQELSRPARLRDSS